MTQMSSFRWGSRHGRGGGSVSPIRLTAVRCGPARPRSAGLLCLAALILSAPAAAFTVYSNTTSYMGAGTFYGPGRLDDSVLFDVVIRNVAFTSEATFVTPFFNNGPKAPNVAGEIATTSRPDGFFSDGTTPINENADVGPFELNGQPFLVGIGGGGAHHGEQISVLLDRHTMIMTMDIVFDMGIGAAGIVAAPFYGTTGEATLPASLQTQLGFEGGIDRAGSLAAGDRLRGRLGDYNNDGMLDGAIVVTGNMPLDSVFMPGAPYALIRYFETDMPYDGETIGTLPGSLELRAPQAGAADHAFPAAAVELVPRALTPQVAEEDR